MDQIRAKVLEKLASATGLPAAEIQLSAPPDAALGDFAFPVFSLAKKSGRNPAEVAAEIAGKIQPDEILAEARAAGPFVNLRIADAALADALAELDPARLPAADLPETVFEFGQANFNKSLHVGHLRGHLHGAAVTRIFAAAGGTIHPVNMINDRGIAVSATNVAYELWENGNSPDAETDFFAENLIGARDFSKKPDHFVNSLYEKWNRENEAEAEKMRAAGETPAGAKTYEIQTSLLQKTQENLQKWEKHDPEVRALWEKIKAWITIGHEETFERLGCVFEKLYFESEFWDQGRDLILEKFSEAGFHKEENGAVAVNLGEKLGKKILLRGDGTTLYMTQDIATTATRIADFPAAKSFVWTVMVEQIYHFEVLFEILERMGLAKKDGLRCLAYEGVVLPSGKMSSRKGNVTSADDFLAEMEDAAKNEILARAPEIAPADLARRARAIADAAVSFAFLRPGLERKIVFEPGKALSFQGDTGPYVLYAAARANSVLKKIGAEKSGEKIVENFENLAPAEKNLTRAILDFPAAVRAGAAGLDPTPVADRALDIAKKFTSFYDACPVAAEPDPAVRARRIFIVKKTRAALAEALRLLGVEALEEM